MLYSIVHGFHSWFVRKRASIFQNQVTSVLKTIYQWHLSFERETERAFYEQEKFRLLHLLMNNFTENLQSIFRGVKKDSKII